MIALDGYKIYKKIYSGNSDVYRAIRIQDNLPVIIKVLKISYPTSEELTRFTSEYEIMSSLESESVIRAYDFKIWNNSFALIMEDIGGETLQKILETRKVSLEEFLNIAIRITGLLGELHGESIIHKDINPHNIIWNTETGQMKLIDLGTASLFSREVVSLLHPDHIEGTLAYMSPEQTGRMNRNIDYRSDFYSLGVTFYKVLTGKLPFRTNDAMELVHCHIAKSVTPPHHEFSECPRIISNIILKLMSKSKENRYQSILGLKVDLEKCLLHLTEKGSIDDFMLGERDHSSVFEIAESLYGREKEVEVLLEGFERTSRGLSEVCLVTGQSGIGKTVLVNEIQIPIVKRKGYFISGKFEQFQQDIPYYGVIQAFRELVKQVLSESDESVQYWKRSLLDALGQNGQVIVDLIPEIEQVIGKQPAVQELNTQETESRFIWIFSRFFSVFAQKEHPLVIFLDDLQWGDCATLNFIRAIGTSIDIPYLYFIGAYRDNEVSESHLLKLTMDDVGQKKVIHNIHINPLELESINQLVADTLNCDKNETSHISEMIHKKSAGNPFFIKELLKSIYKEGLFRFDEKSSKWLWNDEEIQEVKISSNVVSFMIEKLESLPRACQSLLSCAACVGTRFDLNTLSYITKKSLSEILTHLKEAIQEEVIVPLNDKYRISLMEDHTYPDLKGTYELEFKFVHDRIQQAAYSFLNGEDMQLTHLTIGRKFLEDFESEYFEENLIVAVYHLNEGKTLIVQPDEKERVSKLNLSAGIKARKSSAYANAFEYLKIGLEMLPDNMWETRYELSFDMFKEYAQCAYLAGQYEIAEKQIETLLNNVRTDMEKVDVLTMLSLQYSTLGKMEESIKVGVKGLAILGESLPLSPSAIHIMKEYLLIKWNMGRKDVKELVNLPELKDTKKLAMSKLIVEMLPSVYLMGNDNLFVYLVFRLINLSLRYGNSVESAFAYSFFGMLLCAAFGKLREGYEFGKLSMAVNEKYHDLKTKCRVYHCYADFIHHWMNHWSTLTEIQKRGIEVGYQAGDLLYLSFMAHHVHTWNPKLDLRRIQQEKEKYREIIKCCGFKDALDESDLFINTCANYLGMTDGKLSISHSDFDELKCLEEMTQRNYTTGITAYHIWKAEICNFYDEYEQAIKHVEKAKVSIMSVMGLPYTVRFSLITFLAYSGQVDKMASRAKRTAKRVMKQEYRKMKKWANVCPGNFKHLQLIMEGELARIAGNIDVAMKCFSQAIKTALENEWLRDQALANELMAKLYIEIDQDKAAIGYINASCYLYERWGATRKLDHIHEKYGNLIRGNSIEYDMYRSMDNSLEILGEPRSNYAFGLDITTILKSSQAISSEIVLEKLLQKMMKIVIENAGAEKGYFIIEDDNDLVIQAEACLTESEVISLHNISIAHCQCVSEKIINYVARTHEEIVVYDAVKSERFSDELYISKNHIKSVLCIPLKRQDQLQGILYLENNLTAGAFSEDRIEILKLLSSEIIISLENARLYKELEDYNLKLEKEVKARTKELLLTNETLQEKNEKLKLAQRELEHLAMTDPLTKLLNRRSMHDKLLYESTRFERSKVPFSVVLADIDNFKQFNDQNGHDCGDFVLQSISKDIRATLRHQDLVARWGGEELLILLPETDLEGGMHLTEKIRLNIANTLYNYRSIELSITLTFGVSVYNGQKDLEKTIKYADQALYKGKQKGKNCVMTIR